MTEITSTLTEDHFASSYQFKGEDLSFEISTQDTSFIGHSATFKIDFDKIDAEKVLRHTPFLIDVFFSIQGGL